MSPKLAQLKNGGLSIDTGFDFNNDDENNNQ